MNILKEKPLPLLKRKRVTAEIEHFKKATPSKREILKTLAEKLKVSEDKILLLHAYHHFGREKTKIIANVYESKEALEAVEAEEKINKKKKKGEEAKVEAKKDGKEETKK